MILGHSFIRRLREFIDKGTVIGQVDLNGPTVWIHQGGAGLPWVNEQLFKVVERSPNSVYLQIGGNDIKATTNPQVLAQGILDVAGYLLENGIERVIIGSVFPRNSTSRSKIMPKYYRKVANEVNDVMILKTLGSAKIKIDKHDHWIRELNGRIFLPDGVHLNAEASQVYYTQIVSALSSTRTEATRTEATRTEAIRTEAIRTEATRTEATRTEAIRTEAIRTEAIRTEATRTEAIRTEAIRTEATDRECAFS